MVEFVIFYTIILFKQLRLIPTTVYSSLWLIYWWLDVGKFCIFSHVYMICIVNQCNAPDDNSVLYISFIVICGEMLWNATKCFGMTILFIWSIAINIISSHLCLFVCQSRLCYSQISQKAYKTEDCNNLFHVNKNQILDCWLYGNGSKGGMWHASP